MLLFTRQRRVGPGPSSLVSNQLFKLGFAIVLCLLTLDEAISLPDFSQVICLLLKKWSSLRLPLDECNDCVDKLLEIGGKYNHDYRAGSLFMRYFAAASLDVELLLLAPALVQLLPCGSAQTEVIWTLFETTLTKVESKQRLALKIFPRFFANVCSKYTIFKEQKLRSRFVSVPKNH